MSGRRKDEAYALGICDEILGAPSVREASFDWLLGDRSNKTGRAVQLPVDAYWPDLGLVVEFWEYQHDVPTAFFDRRLRTVSGVPRREQRQLYDDRRAEAIPKHGLNLLIIRKAELATTSQGALRYDRDADLRVIGPCLAPFAAGGTTSHQA